MSPPDGKKSLVSKWTEEKPVKVEKWDINAVKNALDDACKKVLNDGYECVEDHSLIDGRLAICTVAVLFSGFALIWDFLHPFPASRFVLFLCSASYFLLMGVLTVYTSIREKSCFYIGRMKDQTGMDPDDLWVLSSNIRKFEPTYHLTVEFRPSGKSEGRHVTLSKCVSEYFDETGTLDGDKLSNDLQKLSLSLRDGKKNQ